MVTNAISITFARELTKTTSIFICPRYSSTRIYKYHEYRGDGLTIQMSPPCPPDYNITTTVRPLLDERQSYILALISGSQLALRTWTLNTWAWIITLVMSPLHPAVFRGIRLHSTPACDDAISSYLGTPLTRLLTEGLSPKFQTMRTIYVKQILFFFFQRLSTSSVDILRSLLYSKYS